MLELKTLCELGGNDSARIYIGFDKHLSAEVARTGIEPRHV